jgi:hypothetical protein
MSRIELPIKAGIEASSAFVGWDRPLLTFFAQVFKADPEDPEEVIELLWAGASEGELPRPVDAIRLLEPFCEISAEIAVNLEIDRMRTLAAVDGPNQAEAKAFLKRLDERRDG